MTTKKKLSVREANVRRILEQHPEARDSDRILTLLYHETYNGVSRYDTYEAVMFDDGLPSEESLGRCRRRIQAEDESLRGSKAKEKIRIEDQRAYIEYAIEER